MKFSLISAGCKTKKGYEGGIGYHNDLPWPKIPEDLEYFSKVTTYNYVNNNDSNSISNNVIIMGRKTWESIPKRYKPLPDRTNIIISESLFEESNLEKRIEIENLNVLIFSSLENAFNYIEHKRKEYGKVFIVGGESLYKECIRRINECEHIYFTRVHNRYLVDTYFPLIDKSLYEKFISIDREDKEIRYTFEVYRNIVELDDEKDNIVRKMISNKLYLQEQVFYDIDTDETKYLNLLKHIMKNGKCRNDRTGTGTISVFGYQLRFNARNCIPVLTTKRVYWKGVVEELLWFLRGDTNINHLMDKSVHIWDGNSSREYLDSIGLKDREERDGGPIYGFQWRHFGAEYGTMHDDYTGKGYDQFAECLRLIRENPTSRRIIMNAWNPCALDKMCLPPCHVQYQFYVNTDTDEISCHMYQRSADVFLGLPFNISSTALLTYIIANITGKKVGDIVISLGDAHIYSNHIEQCNTQLERIPREFPKLNINTKIDENKLDELRLDNFVLEGYKPYSTIKAKMAV